MNIKLLTQIEPSMPGRLQSIWNQVNIQLYHKLNPVDNSGQPYIYTYIDKKDNFPNTKYDSFSFPIQSSLLDVDRLTQFLTSGKGLLFLTKQALLQTGNAFNETRIYSPTEILVSVGRGATLYIIPRVTRHLDISGGLLGVLTSMIGISTGNIKPPQGTVAAALPPINVTTGGHGLIRAQTANAGLNKINTKWTNNSSNGPSLIASLFANIIPASQTGISYSSDEGIYGLMIADKLNRLSSIDKNGINNPLSQLWVAGGKIIRKNGEYPTEASRLFVTVDSNGNVINNVILNSNITNNISGVGDVGYSVNPSTNTLSPGYRYGDSVGVNSKNVGDFTNSDIMFQFSDYSDKTTNYPTKKADSYGADIVNKSLNAVLSAIQSNGIYSVDVGNLTDSAIFNIGDNTSEGYNKLFNTKKQTPESVPGFQSTENMTGINYPLGVLKQYRDSNVKLVSDDIATKPNNSLRLATSNNYDAINTLTVLNNVKRNVNYNTMEGWSNVTWFPYVNDQIAFYFYDIVNQKYIPFRATIKGLNFANTSDWESLSYIGRADKLYSYDGFTRELSFNFNIVISSISELAPTWQRINYLATSVKPANYTTSGVSHNISNRYVVPPMFYVTIGDMYKNQPIIIKSINGSVPDDAIWETLSQENSGVNWNYMAGYITSPNITNFGQLPREVNISMNMSLLEKEQPIVGGAEFGDAFRTDIFNVGDWNTNVPLGKTPTTMDQSLIVSQ